MSGGPACVVSVCPFPFSGGKFKQFVPSGFAAFNQGHSSLLVLIQIFPAVRIVAFSVRAYMQKHLSQNLAIVYEVGVGIPTRIACVIDFSIRYRHILVFMHSQVRILQNTTTRLFSLEWLFRAGFLRRGICLPRQASIAAASSLVSRRSKVPFKSL